MSSREIVLWLDERWYAALERHLKSETLQERLESFLDELCNHLLPDYEYEQISKEVYEERMEREAQREADRRFAVFRVTERGEQSCFLVEQTIDLLAPARSMRHYSRRDDSGSDFRHYYATAADIPLDTFNTYAQERRENTGRVVGAFDIDLDAGMFASLDVAEGWRAFTVKDVSTAAYHADRKNYESNAERTEKLLGYLAGKKLAPKEEHPQDDNILRGARRLRPEDISFADEICEMDGKLNYYIESFGGIDEVFGTHVCTTQNDDYVNVYADYDMQRSEVSDTLTVILHRGDGSDVEYAYPLTAEERTMLLSKMEAYCQQRDGMTLSGYRDQYLAEQRQERGVAPSMTMEQTI